MKAVRFIPAVLLLGILPLHGLDLRETQFPAKLPRSIIVAGADHPARECLSPWITADPAEYSGMYRSLTITDGTARLEIKVHRAKSTEGDLRWHVDGTWETKVGLGVHHWAGFRNAELLEPKQPCFDVLERLTPGLFVLFRNPETKDRRLHHAVVIGDKVFVRAEELKSGG